MQRADADCCLSDLGSIHTPKCIIDHQRKVIMAKGGQKGVDSPPGACIGRSLIEMLEDELDECVDWLNDAGPQPEMTIADMKGQAMGLAKSIAIVLNPYSPNVDGVRADSVRRRQWRVKAREAEDIESGN
jgi:hypothetical protein